MLKILHFSLQKSIPSGVLNQLRSEHEASKLMNAEVRWEIKVFSHDKTELPFQSHVRKFDCGIEAVNVALNYLVLRMSAYTWYFLNKKKYDITLFRYRSGDIFLYILSIFFRNVYTIHHSKELEEAKSRYGSGGKVEELIESTVGKRTLSKSKGIIGVTNEIVEYERKRVRGYLPAFCYPNGIDMLSFPAAGDKRSGPVNLIFISSFYTAWHGLDLLVKEIISSKEELLLHIVGDIRKDIFESDPRIIFHGSRDGGYISELIGKCDAGLGSFALHRIGLSESSHLKVREYLAAGLPVYSGYSDSGIPPTFPFYKVGPLTIGNILEFARECKKYSREQIRSSSEEYICKAKIMNNLLEWLKNQN